MNNLDALPEAGGDGHMAKSRANWDARKKNAAKARFRGTQTIHGERRHLEEVLASVARARLPRARKAEESRALKKMIDARKEELNRITPRWDQKLREARNRETSPERLLRLGRELAPEDYLLARALSEHPQAPPELLAALSVHPYAAARENVARHPKTPPSILKKMAEEQNEPLWFLVACNPSTPEDLRARLRSRLQQTSSASPAPTT